MEKILRLSDFSRVDFSRAINEIYERTDYNTRQYQEYYKWFFQKSIPRVLDKKGDILFAMEGFRIIALANIKNTLEEKKICTLLVEEEYRKKGLGTKLLLESFSILNTSKPVITIEEGKLKEYMSFINEFNWKETSSTKIYTNNEIIFNENTCK